MAKIESDTETDVERVDNCGERDLTSLRRAEIEASKARMREVADQGSRHKRVKNPEPKDQDAANLDGEERGGIDWKQVLARMMEAYSVDSQRKLADVFCLSESAVTYWGRKSPGFPNLEKVVSETGVSWDWLLTGKDDGGEPKVCAASVPVMQGGVAEASGDPVAKVLGEIDGSLRRISREAAREERPTHRRRRGAARPRLRRG